MSQVITISSNTPVVPPTEGFLAQLNRFLKDLAPEGFMPTVSDLVLGLGTIASLVYAVCVRLSSLFLTQFLD
jgi:hypothetical protein